MSGLPKERGVPCPECNATAIAVVPERSVIVDGSSDADGKVWVSCRSCDEQFLVHYRTDE